MIQLTSATKLQNVITKARTVKPFVRINCFGSYSVTNRQTGATYTVECCIFRFASGTPAHLMMRC